MSSSIELLRDIPNSNDIMSLKKLVLNKSIQYKNDLLDVMCYNSIDYYDFIKYLLDIGVNPNNSTNWFNCIYKTIMNHHFKSLKLLSVYGANINGDYFKFFNTKYTNMYKVETDWIKLVKKWSRFRIACSFMTKNNIIDLSKRNVIKLDFDKEIKDTLVDTSHNIEIKRLVESYYKGWKPNIHYIFPKQIKSTVFTIMMIDNMINNMIDNNTFYLKQYFLPKEIWYSILNFI